MGWAIVVRGRFGGLAAGVTMGAEILVTNVGFDLGREITQGGFYANFAQNLPGGRSADCHVQPMETSTVMRPLTAGQYAKRHFRADMAAKSYPEKVQLVVRMQERLVPMYAARGRIIVPWTLDSDEVGS